MASKASKSGNPAVRASSAADFKKRTGGFLPLPSGLTVKVHNSGGLRAFVSSGMIPNSLMGLVQNAINKGQEPSEEEIAKLIGVDSENLNTDAIDDMLKMTDSVVCEVVVDPEVFPKPADDEERDEDLLYVDEMDDEDKAFIFQWVTGGTRDIEQFRREQGTSLDSLVGRSSAKKSTKRAPRTKR